MLQGFGGQRVAARIIANVLKRETVPHAYLIAGPRGTGKAEAALSLGRLLACHAPEGETEAALHPCGRCPSCVLPFRAGAHHDLVTIEPEPPKKKASSSEGGPSAGEQLDVATGVIRVEQVREAERTLNRSLVAAKRRICIVPDAERMCRTASAGNAFLKTLEEPPRQTVIIMTTSNLTELLPTILSRCLVLPFGPLGDDVLTAELLRAGPGPASEEQARLAARVSAGRRSLAQRLLSVPDMARVREEALEVLRQGIEGDPLSLLRAPDTLVSLCVRWWSAAAGTVLAGDEGQNARERMVRSAAADVLGIMESYLRDAMLLAGGAGEDQVANSDRLTELREDARRWPSSVPVQALRVLSMTRRIVSQNVSSRLAFEVAFLKLCRQSDAAA
jgi:DNA polymerase III subunit delta'